jgi:branched-subunit amino acid transport protein AzlD
MSLYSTRSARCGAFLFYPPAPAMKIIVAIAFVLIIGSLASALLFMMLDKGKSNRTVYALTMRVGFSVLLFILLLIAYRLGWIQPTGIH